MVSRTPIQRLTSRSDYEFVKKHGKTIKVQSWLLGNFVKNQKSTVRVGWTVPSYVGPAVVRNRLKRWIREYLKKLNGEILINPCDINVVFRRKEDRFYKQIDHKDFDASIEELFSKIKTQVK